MMADVKLETDNVENSLLAVKKKTTHYKYILCCQLPLTANVMFCTLTIYVTQIPWVLAEAGFHTTIRHWMHVT